MDSTLFLKPGREKSVRQRHPWIYSGAIERVAGSPQVGATVLVCTAEGERLGWAAYSPTSQIRARMWTFNLEETINQEFFRQRLKRAMELRNQIIPPEESNALRLVHAESDGLPGLIVDRYATTLVMQCLSAGADSWREMIADLLVDLTGFSMLYERSDVDVRRLEGLEPRTGLLRGQQPQDRVEIQENGLRFWVDITHGQKTGFYIDQRRNRKRVGELVRDLRVLNCFCYTGGFSVYALAGGAAEILSIDSSADALRWGKSNLALNNLSSSQASWLEGDVFHELRKMRDRAQSYDAIILDPPKFAPTAAQAEQAARGYKDINLLAFKLLRPGGLLFTFSCSGGISAELFQKIIAGAAQDAGTVVQVIERLTQGPDHPVALNFPEGAYLKGLVCKKSE